MATECDAEKVPKRWTILLGAVLVHIALSALYGWGAFTPALKDPLGEYAFSAVQTQLIFSASVACMALTIIPAGWLQDRIGPRPLSLAGSTTMGLGYILAGTFGGTSPTLHFIFIGLMGGIGAGIAYVSPVVAGQKWYPERKGFATGVIIGGFGGGAFIWVQLATPSFDYWGFEGLVAGMGLPRTFQLLGTAFIVLGAIGGILLRDPTKDWTPPCTEPKNTPEPSVLEDVPQLSAKEMMRTRTFHLMWVIYLCGSFTGLLAVGNIQLFGEVERGFDPGMVALGLSLLALFNAAGRIGWGMMFDRIGVNRSLTIILTCQAILLLSLGEFLGRSVTTLVIGSVFIGAMVGGTIAAFPTATGTYFGHTHMGNNYGWVSTAYVLGGIFGPLIAGWSFDSTGTYVSSFYLGAILCIIGAVLARMLPDTG